MICIYFCSRDFKKQKQEKQIKEEEEKKRKKLQRIKEVLLVSILLCYYLSSFCILNFSLVMSDNRYDNKNRVI